MSPIEFQDIIKVWTDVFVAIAIAIGIAPTGPI